MDIIILLYIFNNFIILFINGFKFFMVMSENGLFHTII